MKILGYIIHVAHGDEFIIVTGTTDAMVTKKLADWCRDNWPPKKRVPKKDKIVVEAYFDTSDDYAEYFEDELDLSITELRDAYCSAINAGLTEALDRGDEEWLDDQMQELNDSLPKGWYVYSDDELAEVRRDAIPMPQFLSGSDDFPHLPQ